MVKFFELVKQAQETNEGSIVLAKSGAFYTGLGKDAVILSELFGLKPICHMKGICKCGIPIGLT